MTQPNDTSSEQLLAVAAPNEVAKAKMDQQTFRSLRQQMAEVQLNANWFHAGTMARIRDDYGWVWDFFSLNAYLEAEVGRRRGYQLLAWFDVVNACLPAGYRGPIPTERRVRGLVEKLGRPGAHARLKAYFNEGRSLDDIVPALPINLRDLEGPLSDFAAQESEDVTDPENRGSPPAGADQKPTVRERRRQLHDLYVDAERLVERFEAALVDAADVRAVFASDTRRDEALDLAQRGIRMFSHFEEVLHGVQR